jgi:glutamate-1-semialdehyde 2,1-aminomutase
MSDKRAQSAALYQRANRVFPGGVNSPVRAFKAVGGTPVFIQRGIGAYVYDVDGNRYVDFVGSWGPLVLGHADPDVIAAIVHTAASGTTFGAPTAREVELGELLQFMIPSLEKMRLVSSGTEATMSALRVARGFTERAKIIKIDGGYHGHSDQLLVAAGSGAVTLGIPGSAGVTAGSVADTIVVPFNDLDAMRSAFETHPGQIAAVIVEPIVGNMGVVLPRPAYLPVLRALCDQHGALLIFDEVITGFRVGRGGAQEMYGVRPDLTTLGKIAGGGLPLGIYGGRADIMNRIAPEGPVYQAGTLSGNPLATAAGLAVLRRLRDPSVYEELERKSARLESGLLEAGLGRFARVNRVGAMLTAFVTDAEVRNFDDARACDADRYGALFRHLLAHGVYIAPSQFESMFVSLAHSDDDVDRTVEAVADFFRGN